MLLVSHLKFCIGKKIRDTTCAVSKLLQNLLNIMRRVIYGYIVKNPIKKMHWDTANSGHLVQFIWSLLVILSKFLRMVNWLFHGNAELNLYFRCLELEVQEVEGRPNGPWNCMPCACTNKQQGFKCVHVDVCSSRIELNKWPEPKVAQGNARFGQKNEVAIHRSCADAPSTCTSVVGAWIIAPKRWSCTGKLQSWGGKKSFPLLCMGLIWTEEEHLTWDAYTRCPGSPPLSLSLSHHIHTSSKQHGRQIHGVCAECMWPNELFASFLSPFIALSLASIMLPPLRGIEATYIAFGSSRFRSAGSSGFFNKGREYSTVHMHY
jgi:hypothetical protein